MIFHGPELRDGSFVPHVAVVLDMYGSFRASYRSSGHPGHAQCRHHLVITIGGIMVEDVRAAEVGALRLLGTEQGRSSCLGIR